MAVRQIDLAEALLQCRAIRIRGLCTVGLGGNGARGHREHRCIAHASAFHQPERQRGCESIAGALVPRAVGLLAMMMALSPSDRTLIMATLTWKSALMLPEYRRSFGFHASA